MSELHEEGCEEEKPAVHGGSVLGSPTKPGARVAAGGTQSSWPWQQPQHLGVKSGHSPARRMEHTSSQRVLSPLILVTIIYISCLFQA